MALSLDIIMLMNSVAMVALTRGPGRRTRCSLTDGKCGGVSIVEEGADRMRGRVAEGEKEGGS